MIYKDFFSKLKKDEIENYYLFTGEEEYMMKLALEELKNKYISNDFETLNYNVIDGKNANLDTLINASETLPFMSSKKIVILKDISNFLEELDDKAKEQLYKYIVNLGDFLVLIFMDGSYSLKKNTKFYKLIKKNDRQVEFTKLIGQDMNKWINTLAKKNIKKISQLNIKYFIDQTSYNSRNVDLNLYDLENEFLKIVDYAKEEEITKADIDNVLIKTIDTNIFEFLEAFSSKSTERSLMLFNQMYISGEPIQRMFFMMIRQIRLILGYVIYKTKGYDNKSIQEKLSIKPYEFGKIRNQASGFKLEELENIMQRLLEIDKAMKTSMTDDKLLIETFFVEIGNGMYNK
ncbi:DNA polymerase III subunit delta [Tissierella creatinophila]|uniref:DNA polymerase III subunit delta n=1 Tax=Tissierella creatinophila DSM 6911 TaxID=1123403 RepID=A0A1U7M7X2_TISCR|nr:DNA polymerase III subunit delta [Tissierella creatinophila]OLS03397.1 DNA polymerase III subunit delta [Tissierella creatinophila DSM 6911]